MWQREREREFRPLCALTKVLVGWLNSVGNSHIFPTSELGELCPTIFSCFSEKFLLKMTSVTLCVYKRVQHYEFLKRKNRKCSDIERLSCFAPSCDGRLFSPRRYGINSFDEMWSRDVFGLCSNQTNSDKSLLFWPSSKGFSWSILLQYDKIETKIKKQKGLIPEWFLLLEPCSPQVHTWTSSTHSPLQCVFWLAALHESCLHHWMASSMEFVSHYLIRFSHSVRC